MEKLYEIKTYKRLFECNECGEGEMLYVPSSEDGNGWYHHRCSYCGHECFLDKVYPENYTKLFRVD